MTAVLREFLDAVESGKPGQWGYKIAPALRALLDEVEAYRRGWLDSPEFAELNELRLEAVRQVFELKAEVEGLRDILDRCRPHVEALSVSDEDPEIGQLLAAIDAARQPDPSPSAGRA